MEDDLVMNRLPLPKYYDGAEWNTVIKPTRKCIPKYLHQDLPELKHMYIKQKFKQIGKFNCPKLDYFNTMIKNKKAPKPTGHNSKKSKSTSKNKKNESYSQIKDQLQYALIIADKDSNIIDGLLERAKNVNENKNETPGQKGKVRIRRRNRNSSVSDHGKYFSNTVDLVFRNRKKQYLESLKKQQQIDITEAEQRIDTIKLLNLEG